LTLQQALDHVATSTWDEQIRAKAQAMYNALHGATPAMALPAALPAGIAGPVGMPSPTPGAEFESLDNLGVYGALRAGAQGRQLMLTIPEAPVKQQLSAVQADFQGFFRSLAEETGTGVQQAFGALHKAVDGIADQLAKLATTGRANFRQLFSGIAEELIKSNLERLFAQLGNSLSGGSGGTGSGGSGGGLLSLLGGLFGGGKQHGGAVLPGHAYLVGEKRPELFVPSSPGVVAPDLEALRPHQHQTVLNFAVNGASDFDSFRRSSAQTMALLQNQLAVAYARSR